MVCALIGMAKLFSDFGLTYLPLVPFVRNMGIPGPSWSDGTFWLLGGFVLMNLLVLLEVSDRLSLRHDLEIAREIQLAMLRTLALEDLPLPVLAARLNRLVYDQAPGARFITCFLAVIDLRDGRLSYVNAGQTPPLLRRQDGGIEKLSTGGIALGMFDQSVYDQSETRLDARDLLVAYSHGITEAENRAGHPFDEDGLERAVHMYGSSPAPDLAIVVVKRTDAVPPPLPTRRVQSPTISPPDGASTAGSRRREPRLPAVNRAIVSNPCQNLLLKFGADPVAHTNHTAHVETTAHVTHPIPCIAHRRRRGRGGLAVRLTPRRDGAAGPSLRRRERRHPDVDDRLRG